MQKPFLFLLLALFTCSVAIGQDQPLTPEEKKALDSMLANDDLFQALKNRDRSYFDISLGMGNGVFSIKNKSLDASQESTSKIFYTPSVGYFHKSGFALSFSGYMVSDSGSLKMYQYALSPSYTYDNKTLTAGIFYTRFISGAGTSFSESPFKNDFYASFLYKKTWIQPGLSGGFSTGKSKEYFDTTVLILVPGSSPPRYISRRITDTITTRVSSFSLTASATHEWDFEHLLFKKDALSIQPTFLLNAGSQHWNISHSSSLSKRRPIVQKALKARFGDGSGNESFTLQSIAFSGQFTYYIGKWYLQPQIYLDYYLPSTTYNRLTTLYSVVLGIDL